MSSAALSLEDLAGLSPAAAAAFWAERMQDDEDVAAEDLVLFHQWLEANEANRGAWRRVCAAWEAFGQSGAEEGLLPLRAEALAFRPRPKTRRWLPFAAAASIALFAGGAFFAQYRSSWLFDAAGSRSALPRPVQMVAYTTAVGQTTTVTLRDGTRLTLDTGTEVDVGFTGKARLARLVRGQAFFDVAHDPAHPFNVALADRVITVLGTKFNMRFWDGTAEVLLVQGSIGVHHGRDPAMLEGPEIERLVPGQRLIARHGASDTVMAGDPLGDLSWREGLLRFDNTTIGTAAEAFNRYGGDRLVIDDPQIAALRIGGTFRIADSARFAAIAAELYGLKVKPLEGREITLSR